MIRPLATAVKVALLSMLTLSAGGCGGRAYLERQSQTLDAMRYRKRLDDNLMPAAKEKFEPIQIYLRPPKTLEPVKVFLLTELDPGRFDLSQSFAEKDKQTMHVLARVKLPKDPAKKKAAAAPDPALRGDFNSDVIAILNAVYSVELTPQQAKDESKKSNKFKRLSFEGNGKNVQVYLYGAKTSPYEVAMIFEYPKAEQANLITKIELCLESFAVGERARKLITGGAAEEEPTEGVNAGGGPM